MTTQLEQIKRMSNRRKAECKEALVKYFTSEGHVYQVNTINKFLSQGFPEWVNLDEVNLIIEDNE